MTTIAPTGKRRQVASEVGVQEERRRYTRGEKRL